MNLYRKNGSEYVRGMYLEANKQFKDLCNQKRRDYDLKIAQNLQNVKNAKELGAALREIRNRSFICGTQVSMKTFVEHFKDVMNSPRADNAVLYAEPNICIPFLDDEFTLQEIVATLKKAKNNKAPGYDRIPYEFLNAPQLFLEEMLTALNRIVTTGEVPESFKKSIILPLYKKGDVNIASNYRGISLMDAFAKVFTVFIELQDPERVLSGLSKRIFDSRLYICADKYREDRLFGTQN